MIGLAALDVVLLTSMYFEGSGSRVRACCVGPSNAPPPKFEEVSNNVRLVGQPDQAGALSLPSEEPSHHQTPSKGSSHPRDATLKGASHPETPVKGYLHAETPVRGSFHAETQVMRASHHETSVKGSFHPATPVSVSSSHPRTPVPRSETGYLLAAVYAEQLNAATKHYMSLLNVAADWGMKGVEPFIGRSRLYGTHCLRGSKFNVEERFHLYGRFFNISQVNKVMSHCLIGAGHSIITTRAEFLTRSYRDITAVHFVHPKSLPVASYCISSSGNRPYVKLLQQSAIPLLECTTQATNDGMINSVEEMLNGELKDVGSENVKRFKVKTVICVDAQQPLSWSALRELATSFGRNRSIIFIHWQGVRTVASFSGPSDIHRCSVSHVQHSAEVDRATSSFLNSLAIKRPFLSLHVRSERIIHSNSLHSGYSHCCMQRLQKLLRQIIAKHQLQDVLLVRDYGDYGTDTCFYGMHTRPRAYCKMLSDRLMTQMGTWGIRYAAFDPVKYGAVDNSGFVSLVESDALLQGSALLTVGYGSFQGQLRSRFIEKNDTLKDKSYKLCPSYIGSEEVHNLHVDSSCESQFP